MSGHAIDDVAPGWIDVGRGVQPIGDSKPGRVRDQGTGDAGTVLPMPLNAAPASALAAGGSASAVFGSRMIAGVICPVHGHAPLPLTIEAWR